MDLSGSPTTTAPLRWRRGRRLLGALALALVAFAAGRLSAPQAVTAETVSPPVAPALHTRSAPAAGLERVQQQAPDDPRELIPLPGPGQQPGQQPGPGQTGECPLFLYQDGQLFRFDAPGGQPGGQPGQGGSPELFPLQPVPPPGQPLPVPPRQEEAPLDLVRFDRHTTLLARR